MNWFSKIKAKITEQDDSPHLKRGQVKQLLIAQLQEETPDFEFLEYKNGCYTFERVKSISELKVFEHFHIIFALKDRNFSCSIASRINRDYRKSNSYNTGLVNPHIDLITLKKGTGVIPVEEAYYFHNGRVKTTTEIIRQIVFDFKKFGIPFFKRQIEQIQNSNLIKVGLEFINKIDKDKESLKAELETELKNGGYLISSLKNETFLQLKSKLQSLKGNDRDTRKKIPKLAYELLDYYSNENIASA
jgi:hypothetical protein